MVIYATPYKARSNLSLLLCHLLNQQYMNLDLDDVIERGAYAGCTVHHVLLSNPQYIKFMQNNGYIQFTNDVLVFAEIATDPAKKVFKQDQMHYFIMSFCPQLVLS